MNVFGGIFAFLIISFRWPASSAFIHVNPFTLHEMQEAIADNDVPRLEKVFSNIFRVIFLDSPIRAAWYYNVLTSLINTASPPCTALEKAAEKGDEKMMTYLLGKIEGLYANSTAHNLDSTAYTRSGRTLLNTALFYRNANAARCLIKAGASVRVKDEIGNTSLHIAACKNVEVTELILGQNVSVHDRNKFGETAFFKAVQYDLKDVAEILLAAGSDIETFDDEGRTTLHVQMLCKNEEMMEFLLRKGIRLDTADFNGNYLLDVALSHDYLDKISSFLIECGADISKCVSKSEEIFRYLWPSSSRTNEEDERENAGDLNFDDYLARISKRQLTDKIADPANFNVRNQLHIYAKLRIFASYRIAKENYVKAKGQVEKESEIERGKFLLFDFITLNIFDKTYLGKVPFDLTRDVLFHSEYYWWKIERLSLYLALISFNANVSIEKMAAFAKDSMDDLYERYLSDPFSHPSRKRQRL